MKELLQELTNVDPLRSSPVHYLQSQNSNLEGDLKLLREDAGSIPCFARDVFGQLLSQ